MDEERQTLSKHLPAAAFSRTLSFQILMPPYLPYPTGADSSSHLMLVLVLYVLIVCRVILIRWRCTCLTGTLECTRPNEATFFAKKLVLPQTPPNASDLELKTLDVEF